MHEHSLVEDLPIVLVVILFVVLGLPFLEDHLHQALYLVLKVVDLMLLFA